MAGGTAPSDREGTQPALARQRSPQHSHQDFHEQPSPHRHECQAQDASATMAGVTALSPPRQGYRELSQLCGNSSSGPTRKACWTTAFVLKHHLLFICYQAHICSATVHDGIQELTSNPMGGTWLQTQHSSRKSTEHSGKTTWVQCSAQAVLLRDWRPVRLKLGIQLTSKLTCASASDLNTSYPPCI